MIKWLFKYGAVIFLFNSILLSIEYKDMASYYSYPIKITNDLAIYHIVNRKVLIN
jgi:uncharacterized protein with PQ loop repeat